MNEEYQKLLDAIIAAWNSPNPSNDGYTITPELNKALEEAAEYKKKMEDTLDWRVIPGFPKYEINLLQEVRLAKNKHMIAPHFVTNEPRTYYLSELYSDRVSRCYAHELVELAFPEFYTPDKED